MNTQHTTTQKIFAEFLGTLLLLCTVIGSGIMAERLCGGNVAIALLGNTLATIFILYVLIETLSPISGAHFNPLVSFAMLWRDSRPQLVLYIAAQLAGAIAGAWLAHAMFDMSILQFSSKIRTGPGQWIAEVVATAGLIFVILRSSHTHAKASALVASYIGAAYWFFAQSAWDGATNTVNLISQVASSGIDRRPYHLTKRESGITRTAIECGIRGVPASLRSMGSGRTSQSLARSANR